MRKILLVAIFIGISFFAIGQKPILSTLQNYDGIPGVTYEVRNGQTLNTIANLFYVKLPILLAVNNFTPTSNVKTYQKIIIPLTETNFLKLKGIQESKEFIPIYYFINTQITKNDMCNLLAIQKESFDKWNNAENEDELPAGKGVIVGWLKYNANNESTEFLSNTIDAKKTINSKNTNEIIASKNDIKKQKDIELPKVKSTDEIKNEDDKFSLFKKKKVNSISETKLSEENEEPNEAEKTTTTQDNTQKETPLANLKKKIHRGGYEPYKTRVVTPVTPAKPTVTNNYVNTPTPKNVFKDSIQKNTYNTTTPKNVYKNDLPSNVVVTTPEKKKKETLAEKWKKLIANKEGSQEETVIAKDKTIEKKAEPIIETKITKAKNNTTKKVEEIIAPKEEIKPVEKVVDNTIHNEIKPLSLVNSKNGKASLFYSGPTGGKFYVVTNLAKRGEILKVTNTSNGKSVMAEVISSLPNSDISKGLLVKLSDNAKLPLGIANTIFYVKINY